MTPALLADLLDAVGLGGLAYAVRCSPELSPPWIAYCASRVMRRAARGFLVNVSWCEALAQRRKLPAPRTAPGATDDAEHVAGPEDALAAPPCSPAAPSHPQAPRPQPEGPRPA